MKKLLTLTFICFFISFAFSQEKWGSIDGSIAGSHYVIVEACGDSIDVSPGNWYEKMHISNGVSTNELAGRQVIGDSVFFKYNLLDDSAPILLYDYSVEVGDTINGFWGEFIVTEVDTEFATGEERKRITMENTFNNRVDIWLSGLGSKVSGYLQPGSPIYIPDAGSEFTCYLDVNIDEYYYGDQDPALCAVPAGSACMPTSVDDKEIVENILIFPNPADDFITIKIENSSHKKIYIQLFSIDGKQVVIKNSDGDNMNLDVSNLMAGIYLLKINHNDNLSFHKIVIQ
jgi:hypothetical protein